MSLNCSTCELRDEYCKGLVYYCKKECIRHGLLKSEIFKLNNMNNVFVTAKGRLELTKAELMSLTLSDFDDNNHINKTLDAIYCIDNALTILKKME